MPFVKWPPVAMGPCVRRDDDCEIARVYERQQKLLSPVAKIVLADFAGLPCSDKFRTVALGVSMQMH
jgi:hypothetical protein